MFIFLNANTKTLKLRTEINLDLKKWLLLFVSKLQQNKKMDIGQLQVYRTPMYKIQQVTKLLDPT